MPDNATIWTTKAPVLEFDTIEFRHSYITPVRIVANQYDTKVLLGNEYQPCYVEVQYPKIDGESQPEASFSMARPVVGDIVQRTIRSIPPFMRIKEPVKVIMSHWSDSDLTAPMFSYELDLSNEGVSMSVDSVTFKVEKLNNMTRSVARIYTIEDWSGLEAV